MGVNSPKEWLKGLELDGGKFVDFLGKLIGENKFLQNNPQELIPKEDRAMRHVLDHVGAARDQSWRPFDPQTHHLCGGKGEPDY
ncbi:unnamed protein product [Calypogeia fissa]